MTVAAGWYLAGYLTALAEFVLMARRRGLATAGIALIATAALLGGLASANLTQRLVTGAAGKTILGGIAGGYLAAMLAKRLLGIRRPTGDLFAVAVSAGEAIGRWGCFFGGCCYGRETHVGWAVWQHGALRHPAQIYLSLASLAILIALLRFERAKPPENALFFLQGLLYCAARFGVEFFREPHSVFGSLTAAQWACLGGGVFFAVKLRRLPAAALPHTLLPEPAPTLAPTFANRTVRP